MSASGFSMVIGLSVVIELSWLTSSWLLPPNVKLAPEPWTRCTPTPAVPSSFPGESTMSPSTRIVRDPSKAFTSACSSSVSEPLSVDSEAPKRNRPLRLAMFKAPALHRPDFAPADAFGFGHEDGHACGPAGHVQRPRLFARGPVRGDVPLRAAGPGVVVGARGSPGGRCTQQPESRCDDPDRGGAHPATLTGCAVVAQPAIHTGGPQTLRLARGTHSSGRGSVSTVENDLKPLQDRKTGARSGSCELPIRARADDAQLAFGTAAVRAHAPRRDRPAGWHRQLPAGRCFL